MAIDDAMAMGAARGQIVERRGIVVAGELGVEMHGRRGRGAAGVDLELAFVVVAVKDELAFPLPGGAAAAVRALPLPAAMVADPH